MRRIILVLLLYILFAPNYSVFADDCWGEHADPSCDNNNVIDGYWWRDRHWIPGYPTVNSWFSVTPDWQLGSSVFYAPKVMESTAEWRGMSLNGYLDGVSMLSCSDIGEDVWLKRSNEQWEGPFLVVDCAMRGDIYGAIVVRDEIVEVGFKTAERWGMARLTHDDRRWEVIDWKLTNVQLLKIDPELLYAKIESSVPLIDGYKRPTDLSSWWLDRISYSRYIDRSPLWLPDATWLINGEVINFNN